MKPENRQNKLFIISISSVAAIGGFLFGFDTGVISGTLIFLQDAKGWALTESQLGGVTTAVLLGLCFHFQNELGDLFSIITIATMILFIGSFAVSFGPLSWLIISEIFPLKFRRLGMSIGAFTLWSATTIVNYSFLKIVDALTLAGTFWAFAIMGVLSGIWGYIFIPETKGKSLESIEGHWRQGKKPAEL
jgi:MFS transporter, SP family, galactose:H+ symporter